MHDNNRTHCPRCASKDTVLVFIGGQPYWSCPECRLRWWFRPSAAAVDQAFAEVRLLPTVAVSMFAAVPLLAANPGSSLIWGGLIVMAVLMAWHNRH